MTATSPRHPFAATYLLIGAAAVAVPAVALVAGLPTARYPMAIVSVAVFVAATATRTSLSNLRPLISPQTVAYSVWCLLLVIFPSALNWFPAALGQLPILPSDRSVNLAMLLNTVAFISFTTGNQLRLARRSDQVTTERAPMNLRPLIGWFAALGILGIALRFGSLDAFTSYTRGVGSTYLFEKLTGLHAVLSSVLPPFLSFSFVMLLELWRLTKKLTVPRGIIAGLGVVFPLTLYSYNRAAFVIPLVGMVGVLGALGRRRRNGTIVIFAIAVALGAYQAGNIRKQITATEGGRYTLAQANYDPANGQSLWQTLSVYGQSPQLSAFALTVPLSQDYPGQSLVSSALSPVPGLGKYFRDSNGTIAYNLAIYGTPETVDQVMPLTAESWGSLGLLGTVLVFGAIGVCIGHAHRRFLAEKTVIRSYIVIVVGLWVSLAPVVSLLVIAQVFVYFLWPHLTFVFICALREYRIARTTPAGIQGIEHRAKPRTALNGSRNAH